jgi:GAF domain-containing protein
MASRREFQDRIDGLGPDWRSPLDREMLLESDDPELNDIAAHAAEAIGAPIAIVSLILQRIQLFRAHVGLPPDLAVARATDRDASFCQFVVRDDDTFVVEHAAEDPRVPQDLVERYGIQAYLGAPVRIGGRTAGSLCVIDVVPREFGPEERARLSELAAQASGRLEAMQRKWSP